MGLGWGACVRACGRTPAVVVAVAGGREGAGRSALTPCHLCLPASLARAVARGLPPWRSARARCWKRCAGGWGGERGAGAFCVRNAGPSSRCAVRQRCYASSPPAPPPPPTTYPPFLVPCTPCQVTERLPDPFDLEEIRSRVDEVCAACALSLPLHSSRACAETQGTHSHAGSTHRPTALPPPAPPPPPPPPPQFTPYVMVAIQEAERWNALLGEMRRSLAELDLGLRGDLTISEPMVRVCCVGLSPG